MDDIKVSLHIFLCVLILGSLWRLTSYHLMANPNPQLGHLGKAMVTQY
jgi:hypothetical protein